MNIIVVLLFINLLPCVSEGREERIKALEATQQDKVNLVFVVVALRLINTEHFS